MMDKYNTLLILASCLIHINEKLGPLYRVSHKEALYNIE